MNNANTALSREPSTRMTKTDKKIIVSDEVDKQVNSVAVAITFIILGIVLTVRNDFFGDPSITSVVRWVFIVLGVVALLSSFGSGESKIKGTQDVAAGITVLVVALLCFQHVPGPFGGVLAFVMLLFGCYGVVRGVLFMICTIHKSSTGKEGRAAQFASIVEGLSKVAALALVIAQIAKLWLE